MWCRSYGESLKHAADELIHKTGGVTDAEGRLVLTRREG